jgi:hypothetical protein
MQLHRSLVVGFYPGYLSQVGNAPLVLIERVYVLPPPLPSVRLWHQVVGLAWPGLPKH